MFVDPKLIAKANSRLVNQAALAWLKKAKEDPLVDSLHLLSLAAWGMERDPEGPDSRLEQQRSLIRALQGISSPEDAAEVVLEAIASRLASEESLK